MKPEDYTIVFTSGLCRVVSARSTQEALQDVTRGNVACVIRGNVIASISTNVPDTYENRSRDYRERIKGYDDRNNLLETLETIFKSNLRILRKEGVTPLLRKYAEEAMFVLNAINIEQNVTVVKVNNCKDCPFYIVDDIDRCDGNDTWTCAHPCAAGKPSLRGLPRKCPLRDGTASIELETT
jgi:hypothetical protein